MPGQPPDVSQLLEHYGLDPGQYPRACDDLPRFATALAVAAAFAKRNPRGDVCDPVLRSALLRERLLRGDSSH